MSKLTEVIVDKLIARYTSEQWELALARACAEAESHQPDAEEEEPERWDGMG